MNYHSDPSNSLAIPLRIITASARTLSTISAAGCMLLINPTPVPLGFDQLLFKATTTVNGDGKPYANIVNLVQSSSLTAFSYNPLFVVSHIPCS